MSSGPKIVMVGGGSYNWMPRILSDLMRSPSLEHAQVVLLDPRARAAGEVAEAARTMARTLERSFTFAPTTNEAEAFAGADFVIVTISTGGLEMMTHDLAIPERYGIYHTVGDTVGPGGWSRSLRNVPVFAAMARSIERHAPRAVVLNYTNPMASLTGTFAAVSSLRVVGLCHGVFANYRLLQTLFAVEEKELAVAFAGVNHFFWVTDFTVKGEPGYPLLRQRLGDRSIDQALHGGDTDEVGFTSHHALMDELYRHYGYLPYAGDRHTCEFLPGYLTPTLAALDRFGLVRTSIDKRYEMRAYQHDVTRQLASGERAPFERSRETAVDIMEAMIEGKPFIDVMNLPNRGQIANLPHGAVVETLGMADSLGFRPLTHGPLPEALAALVEPHCRVQRMTLQAALDGDRELALQALMLDPICAHLPPSDIRRMGMELLHATRDWLPAGLAC